MSKETGLDISKIISQSSSVMEVGELQRRGYSRVKVVRDSQIQELIAEAVGRIIEKRSRELTEAETAAAVARARREYEARIAEREQLLEESRTLSEQDRRRLEAELTSLREKLEEQNEKLAKERELLTRKAREEFQAMLQQRQQETNRQEAVFEEFATHQKELAEANQQSGEAIAGLGTKLEELDKTWTSLQNKVGQVLLKTIREQRFVVDRQAEESREQAAEAFARAESAAQQRDQSLQTALHGLGGAQEAVASRLEQQAKEAQQRDAGVARTLGEVRGAQERLAARLTQQETKQEQRAGQVQQALGGLAAGQQNTAQRLAELQKVEEEKGQQVHSGLSGLAEAQRNTARRLAEHQRVEEEKGQQVQSALSGLATAQQQLAARMTEHGKKEEAGSREALETLQTMAATQEQLATRLQQQANREETRGQQLQGLFQRLMDAQQQTLTRLVETVRGEVVERVEGRFQAMQKASQEREARLLEAVSGAAATSKAAATTLAESINEKVVETVTSQVTEVRKQADVSRRRLEKGLKQLNVLQRAAIEKVGDKVQQSQSAAVEELGDKVQQSQRTVVEEVGGKVQQSVAELIDAIGGDQAIAGLQAQLKTLLEEQVQVEHLLAELRKAQEAQATGSETELRTLRQEVELVVAQQKDLRSLTAKEMAALRDVAAAETTLREQKEEIGKHIDAVAGRLKELETEHQARTSELEGLIEALGDRVLEELARQFAWSEHARHHGPEVSVDAYLDRVFGVEVESNIERVGITERSTPAIEAEVDRLKAFRERK